MVKYNTHDIITRAEQLADIQNSDFISASEKQYLLNEAWVKVYQSIINANDKTWLKKVYVNNGCKLPKDFYQLSALYTEQGREQITKRNSVQATGYEIVNNRLEISSNYDSSTIVMEYFPIPQTLFYKNEKKIPVDFSKDPETYIDEADYINEGTLYVNDTETEHKIDTDDAAIYLKNGVLTVSNNGSAYFTSYSNMGKTISRMDSNIYAIVGNEVTYDEVVGNIPELSLLKFFAFLTDKSYNNKYWLAVDTISSSSDVYLYNEKKERCFRLPIAASDMPCTSIDCREDGVYFVKNWQDNKVIMRIQDTRYEIFTDGLYVPVSIVNDNSAIYKLNDRYYKSGYGFNTMLEYPSNLYFIILSYMLAVQFKQRQNGDPTILVAGLQDAQNQLYDSLSRDANGNYQMKNVYRSTIW